MDDFQEFVERVKRANPIEEVIEGSGPEYKMEHKHGRFLRGETHNSLVVRVDQGYYVWNSNGGERGDVFNWLQARKGWDFWQCLEYLCDRAKIEMPKIRNEPDMAVRMERRTREDVFMLAQRWMAARLWADQDALVYVRSRCWLDETVREAGLGFTGRGTDAELRDLRGELTMHNIDPESPVAVALIGYRGDVVGWGRKWNIEPQENWVDWKFIPGLIGRTRLVYPHFWGGRVRYFSARNILGAEVNKDGREVKSYNLPVILAGTRQPYYNNVYGPRAEECVIVEGQADAITLGQWEIPAMALAGTAWDDHAETLDGLRNHHDHLYIGLDGDEAGQTALIGRERDWPLTKLVGPMARVLRWPHVKWERAGGKSSEVKDANDWLQAMVASAGVSEYGHLTAGDVTPEQAEEIKRTQMTVVRAVLDNAPTMAEAVATWAGGQKGAKRDEALTRAFQIFVSMDKVKLGLYREKLSKSLGIGVREFNNTLNETAKLSGDEREPLEIVETLGGVIDGWLVEYIYDPETKTAKLAYRDPDRKIGVAEFLEIEGKRYIPKTPTPFIQNGGVIFAGALGPLKSTRELVAILEMFVKQNYLLENRYMSKIIAYYILMTWVYDCFNALCYLRAMGEAGSGKSELMRRVGHVCYRLLPASGASTASSFFRATEMFKGTVFIDEADLHDGGDMSNDLVKFLNLGAMKGNPIWRLEEVMSETGRTYDVSTFSTFGPKLIAMRKDFRDDAVGTRSLTLKLMPREPIELKNAGIKLNIDDEFRKRALNIRNLLLRWRLQTWDPQLEVDEGDMDLEISARLNQVTMPLKALAKDDPELRGEIERFLRAYNAEVVLTRSMTIAARIVEAMWKIHQFPDIKKKYLQKTADGDEFILIGDIRTVANELMDEMNKPEKESEEDTKKRKRDELTARGCGSVIRNELQLQVGTRRGSGFPTFWDDLKMQALAKRYGVEIQALPGVSTAVVSGNGNGSGPARAAATEAPGTAVEMEMETAPFGTDADDLIWGSEVED